MPRPRSIASLAEWLPLGLVVVAEAAWISVLAALLQEFVLREPSLGIPILAVLVVAGAAAARLLGRRLGRWWPVTAVGLVAVAGALGCLAAPAARSALAEGLGQAIATNPGGWTAGLAVLRGFAHARLPLAEGTVARLLGLGVPGIACMAVLGGAIVEPYRTRFLADALVAAVIFVGAAMLALTLARVSAVGQGSGFDWRRNPTWLALAMALLVLAVVAAVPLSAIAGRAIQAFLAIALVPLVVIGLAMGLDRTARRLLGFVALAAVAIYVVGMLLGPNPGAPVAPSAGTAQQAPTSTADQLMAVSLTGLLLAIAVIVILVLTAVWMRRTRLPDEDLVEETRSIDRGSGSPARRRGIGRLRRRADPTGAAEAYVALIEDLVSHPDVRRHDGETPSEHAARLRGEGRADLRLDLLAADYALSRYGGLAISVNEDRRALHRWRVLRARLTRPVTRVVASSTDVRQ